MLLFPTPIPQKENSLHSGKHVDFIRLAFINEFYDLWVWDNLTWNMKLWEKVFYPYLDDKNIDDLLNRIREKNADKPNN